MIWTFKISRIPGPMLQSVQLCDLVSIRLKHTVNLPTICLKHTKMYDMICHDSHTIFFPDGNIETVNYRKNHETPIFGGQNLHVSRFDFPVSLCQATLRNPHILFLVQLVDGRDPLEIPRPIHGIQKNVRCCAMIHNHGSLGTWLFGRPVVFVAETNALWRCPWS